MYGKIYQWLRDVGSGVHRRCLVYGGIHQCFRDVGRDIPMIYVYRGIHQWFSDVGRGGAESV